MKLDLPTSFIVVVWTALGFLFGYGSPAHADTLVIGDSNLARELSAILENASPTIATKGCSGSSTARM